MADRLLPSTAISLRSGSSPHARQALPTKPIIERLRVLRLGKTEQHQVNASAAHGIGKRRHRQGVREATHDLAVLEPAHLLARQRNVVRPSAAQICAGDLALAERHRRRTAYRRHDSAWWTI